MPLKAGGVSTISLAAFCVVLTAFIAREWMNPPRPEIPPVSPTNGASSDNPEVQPFERFEVSPLSEYDEIIERPLFLDTRRPPEKVPEEVVEEEPQEEEEQEFTLLGVMIILDTKVALLEVDEQGKVARLKLGDKVNGWELASVDADKVALRKGEALKNLPLIRNRPSESRARRIAALKRQNRQAARNSPVAQKGNNNRPQTQNNRPRTQRNQSARNNRRQTTQRNRRSVRPGEPVSPEEARVE